MRYCLLVGEEVGEALHRNPKPLCQDVVTRSGCFLCTFHIQMIGLVRDSESEIGLRLDPSAGIVDFLDLIQLVMPDGNMRSLVLTLEDVGELHLDGVTGPVSDSTFRTCGNDQVIVQFGRTLFDRTDHVLANIAGQPLVNSANLRAKTLQLIDGHGANLEAGPCKEILDSLLCSCQLDTESSGTGGVLQRSLGEELEQRP